MKNTQTGRRDNHITPFTRKNQAVRTVPIDDAPWLAAGDASFNAGTARKGGKRNV